MSDASHVFVVTCVVPRGSAEHVRVEVDARTVTALGRDGFRHDFELPPDVAVEGLTWQVHADVLELRVPYRGLARS